MPSRALLRACAVFGIDPGRAEARREQRRRREAAGALARRVVGSLTPGRVVFVTGPSGCGKSTLLAALEARVRRTGVERVLPDGAGRLGATVFDAVAAHTPTPAEALGVLARAGLAEAPLLPRTTRELSEGQRWRLALAVAMARAARHKTVLLADEFASALDRVTAANLARTVRRWASASDARVVAAAANDDLLEALAPDVLVAMRDDGSADVLERPPTGAGEP